MRKFVCSSSTTHVVRTLQIDGEANKTKELNSRQICLYIFAINASHALVYTRALDVYLFTRGVATNALVSSCLSTIN